jgi:nucleotidyltransferase AbiEii toxin of type IV toxin-antitoxin system
MGRVVPEARQAGSWLLSDLQRRVAAVLAKLPASSEFVLAGGGALIAHGDVNRLTRDLDFFTVEPARVNELLPEFEAALRAAGWDVIEEKVAVGFARLVVVDGDERTGVDLATDARLLPVEPSEFGPLLSTEELAVDKVLAVFGRAEARDFVDLAALEPRFGLEHLCQLAAAKDAGFQRSVLLEMLGRFDRLPRDEFDVDDDGFESIVEIVRRWSSALRKGSSEGGEVATNHS